MQSALEREHVDARQLGELLVVTDAVQSFADRAAGSASGAQAISQAILRHIRARAAAGAFDRWSIGVPRDTPLALPAQVAEWLGDDDGHRHLYPLEVAALMTVALRAKGVPAMIAEVYQFRGDRAPADASGQIGYFAVAVYPGEPGEGDPRFYDPYGGREVQPEAERVLTDLQAIGQALNHRALHLLARESDAERAMDESSSAMRLDRRSPGVRAVRGAVLIAAAQPNEGLQELEAARQLRDDPPRRNLLAQIYFAQGDLDAASSQVSSALEDAPDFAAGRATLAAIQLARGESDLARGELEEARRADPDLHLLPMLWAEYYAVTGDTDRAVTEASEGIRRNPGDLRSRLMAARIYRQAARYDLMRREARAILERTPPARRPEMEQLVTRLLGPTALDPEEDALASAEEDEGLDDEGLEDEGPSEPGGLRLDSSLMGGGAQGPSVLGGGGRGPSLL
ncbi:MAG: tetratricopeptide repeat protein, partial [Sandaracinaceae bacterium]|nr:tetratricopeptide repeat protein [Sandaracinaceae bacterium]